MLGASPALVEKSRDSGSHLAGSFVTPPQRCASSMTGLDCLVSARRKEQYVDSGGLDPKSLFH